MGLGKYENIICEVKPHPRTELDQYERDVVEMANNFGGAHFYDYHTPLLTIAASLLHQKQVKVDWSICHNGLFCTMFAGIKYMDVDFVPVLIIHLTFALSLLTQI